MSLWSLKARTGSRTGQFAFFQLPINPSLSVCPSPVLCHCHLPRSLHNRISPTTYLFTEHLMVKINYNWNAETSNTEPHADNDGGSVRKKKCEREREGETWNWSKEGTITSNRLIIDLAGRWGVFQLNFVPINILIDSWEWESVVLISNYYSKDQETLWATLRTEPSHFVSSWHPQISRTLYILMTYCKIKKRYINATWLYSTTCDPIN